MGRWTRLGLGREVVLEIDLWVWDGCVWDCIVLGSVHIGGFTVGKEDGDGEVLCSEE
jgi:hypothetical protein